MGVLQFVTSDGCRANLSARRVVNARAQGSALRRSHGARRQQSGHSGDSVAVQATAPRGGADRVPLQGRSARSGGTWGILIQGNGESPVTTVLSTAGSVHVAALLHAHVPFPCNNGGAAHCAYAM